ncbi:MAG: hypothetical protein ACXVFU_18190, partial [Nocardioidaceae bacterium]
MTKRPHLLLAGLTAALLAGCGTTVPVTEQVSAQGPAGGTALGGPAVAGSTAGSTAPEAPTGPAAALPATTAVPLPGSAGGAPSAGPAATGPTPVDPARAAAAPTTKKPVEVGVVIFPDVNKAAAMFGGSASVGDQKGEVTDAIGWANTHGGLNGHRIVPVFFEVSLTSTQTYAQTYQQICASFTQDHHVVATMFVGNAEAQLPACLAKGGSLYLAHGHYLHAAKDFTALPNMVTPEDAGSDRVAQAMVDQLLARKVV